jgi:ribonuclease BN (tRNA processing enzyme)
MYRANSHFSFFSFRHPESSFQEVIEAEMGKPYFPLEMNELAGQRAFYEIEEQSFQVDDCEVTTRWLNHPQGCMGYRIAAGNRVLAYATDHEPDGGRYDRNLIELAFDADLLILDAQYTREEYEHNRRGWGHGTWQSAVEMARLTRAKALVLFHHDPDRSDEELHAIVRKAQDHFPGVVAASEGMEICLPELSTVEERGEMRGICLTSCTPVGARVPCLAPVPVVP